MPRTTAVLLIACASLLVLDIGLRLGEAMSLPSARAQEVGDERVLAAARGQNETCCFVYNPESEQLAVYGKRMNNPLELQAVRKISWDFIEVVDELSYSAQEAPSVKKMKEIAKDVAKELGKRKPSRP